MSYEISKEGVPQNQRLLAALAHASILFGVVTNGIGGVLTALIIWLTQREKEPYAAFQALQALVYQVAMFVVVGISWCCWGLLWMLMLIAPVAANPMADDNSAPAGIWVGLALLLIPLAISALSVLYALVGAIQALRGRDFRYALIGKWLAGQH